MVINFSKHATTETFPGFSNPEDASSSWEDKLTRAFENQNISRAIEIIQETVQNAGSAELQSKRVNEIMAIIVQAHQQDILPYNIAAELSIGLMSEAQFKELLELNGTKEPEHDLALVCV